jgi:hypothetical protein
MFNLDKSYFENAAFRGPVKAFLAKVNGKTEADTWAMLIQYLVVFGNIIGKSRYVYLEATNHYPRIFCCITGKSSRARKGTSLNQVLGFFKQAFPDWFKICLSGGLSSGEGLANRVRDFKTINTKDGIKEIPTNYDKRVLFEEDEFAQVIVNMKRQGNNLSMLIRKAWDKENINI